MNILVCTTWRLKSSGMWHSVDWSLTSYVLKELVPCWKEAASLSETWVTNYRSPRRHIPEDFRSPSTKLSKFVTCFNIKTLSILPLSVPYDAHTTVVASLNNISRFLSVIRAQCFQRPTELSVNCVTRGRKPSLQHAGSCVTPASCV